MSNACEHGSLKRQCLICEKDQEIEKLQDRIKELEAALKFYAEATNYMSTNIYEDQGELARKILAQQEKEKR